MNIDTYVPVKVWPLLEEAALVADADGLSEASLVVLVVLGFAVVLGLASVVGAAVVLGSSDDEGAGATLTGAVNVAAVVAATVVGAGAVVLLSSSSQSSSESSVGTAADEDVFAGGCSRLCSRWQVSRSQIRALIKFN